jgi:argininosuccinate synthase
MEKVESLFSPEDRMGALEMQNLSVLDNRAFLISHLDATRALASGGGAAPRELSEILGEGEKK